MADIKIEQRAEVHNKFHLLLRDGRTGALKQQGWAYNIILNQGIAKWPKHLKNSGQNARDRIMRPNSDTNLGKDVRFGGYIHLGSGNTAPVATNTGLNTAITGGAKYCSFHDRGYDWSELTSHYTQSAVWDTEELQGENIREVGLGAHTGVSDLSTHALVEDAEGNPITITKGTLDVLTVYSTVFMTVTHNSAGHQFVQGSDATRRNVLLDMVYRNMVVGDYSPSNRYPRLHLGRDNTAISGTDSAVNTEITSVYWAKNDFDISGGGASVSLRIPAETGNHADGIWEIGATLYEGAFSSYSEFDSAIGNRPLFRSVMPLTGVWTGHSITGEELGEGDGIETVYTTQWSPIKSGTLAVYVDSVLQTEGAEEDYTVNLTTGAITFDAAPANGLAVTADYDIDQIPKDENHVLDVEFTIQFADGNA